MTLREVSEILEADVLAGNDKLDREVTTAFGSDLMSDALAYARPGSLLLTGLTNTQVIRTAEVLDIAAIVLVRGKVPFLETLDLARELGIPVLTTRYILFEAAGRLYAKGIAGCVQKV